MNDESIVYGYIKNASAITAEEKYISQSLNRKALNHLTTLDACAFLSRELFSVPVLLSYDDLQQSSVIHFGSAYKGIEYEWGLWITHFEQLLQKMYWDSVIVHLETELSGVHTFTWDSGNEVHVPSNQALNIRCEWQHEIGLNSRSA
jgi:hypothetical protein